MISYYRLDGAFVGTGADLATIDYPASDIFTGSGIWQAADGSYDAFNNFVWTGSTQVSLAGTSATTCGNWTSPSTTAFGECGDALFFNSFVWATGTCPCSGGYRLYCVQTAP